jgi:hypothetical protein
MGMEMDISLEEAGQIPLAIFQRQLEEAITTALDM